MRRWLCLVLALLMLPAAAFAVEDGVVQEAAAVAVERLEAFGNPYLPDESYSSLQFAEPTWAECDEYAKSENHVLMRIDVALRPGLTPGEARRANRLMEQAARGEVQPSGGEAIIGLRQNVVLGVYPLDGEEFGGERVYTLLPFTCLTDEQLLALIDAYDRIGLTFVPEKLTYRNCMRGGNMMRSRPFAQEEWTRSAQLDMLIQRGIADAGRADYTHAIGLHPDYYLIPELGNGEKLTTFQLLPYRSLTDEEILADCVLYGTRDLSEAFDLHALEESAYRVLTRVIKLPIAMELTTIYSDRKPWADMEADLAGDDRLLILSFDYQNEAGEPHEARVLINQRTKEAVYIQLRKDDGGYDTLRVTGMPEDVPAVRDGKENAQ